MKRLDEQPCMLQVAWPCGTAASPSTCQAMAAPKPSPSQVLVVLSLCTQPPLQNRRIIKRFDRRACRRAVECGGAGSSCCVCAGRAGRGQVPPGRLLPGWPRRPAPRRYPSRPLCQGATLLISIAVLAMICCVQPIILSDGWINTLFYTSSSN